MANPFLSVVIPAFNEQARIVSALEVVTGYLSSQHYTWEVLVVDDGSTDDTAELVSQWAKTRLGVRLQNVPHRGKGWAVKNGMLASTGEYRFMCDADLAMPIEGLASFLDAMAEGYDIVIGSRQIAGARRFHESSARHMMGRLFNWTVRFLAVSGFQDTQCGFKCFRGEVADRLFELQKTKGFGFDVEVLFMALKRGLRVEEMPIDWHHQKESKVRPGVDSLLMLRDTMLVRWRSLRGKYTNRFDINSRASSNHAPVSEATQDSDQMVVVVVPTYNEAKNLRNLADRVFALGIPNTKLIVVDDNSPDGTADVARELAEELGGRVELISRPGKQGLGTAYIEGFSRALAEGADYVLQMDADLSHNPEYIPEFLKTLERADVVVGSRYTQGGGVDENWGLKRRLLSYTANLVIRAVAGLKVKDASSGFKAYRANVLRSLDMTQLRCNGFGFQAEVAYALQRMGYKVVEYPIIFVDRTEGRSKMSVSILLEALRRLLLLRWRPIATNRK